MVITVFHIEIAVSLAGMLGGDRIPIPCFLELDLLPTEKETLDSLESDLSKEEATCQLIGSAPSAKVECQKSATRRSDRGLLR
jgi:hypothetical protein